MARNPPLPSCRRRSCHRLGTSLSASLSAALFVLALGCAPAFNPTTRALNPDDEALQSAATPDGKTVFLAGDGGSLRAIDVATGGVRLIAAHAKICRTPAVSPDGKTLAVACSDGSQRYEIRLFDVSTGKYRTITSPKADLFPAWSKDGNQIYFLRAGKTQGDGFGLPASDFRIVSYDVRLRSTQAIGKETFLNAQGLAATANGVVVSGSDPADYTKDILVEYEIVPTGVRQIWSRPLATGVVHSTPDGVLAVAYLGHSNNRAQYDFEVCRVPKSGSLVPLTSLKTYIESFDPVANGAMIVLDSPTRDHRYRLLRIDEDGRETSIVVQPRV